MATKRKIQLPSVNGLLPSAAAGTVGILDLPLGYRYHQIDLVYVDGGSSPTDILSMFGDIILYKNSKPLRTHSASELDHLNGLNGSQYQRQQELTGANMRQIQTIYFAEPWRKDKSDTDAMAWSVDTNNGYTSFQLKITLLAALPSTATVLAFARVDAPLAPPKNGVQSAKKVYRYQTGAAGTGQDFTNLDQTDAYQVIAIKNPTGAYVQYATVKSQGNFALEKVHQLDNAGDLTNLGLNPASSQTAGAFAYDIVFDADDPINSALVADPNTAKLWLHLDYSAAASGSVTALIERLGPLQT